MEARSPYYQLRQIEMTVRRIRPDAEAERGAHVATNQLQKRAMLATTSLRDYEQFQLEEDTKAQLRNLPKSIKSLEQLRDAILKASEYDLIGVVDVGMMTATIDELITRLR